jgi:hypothetical protein
MRMGARQASDSEELTGVLFSDLREGGALPEVNNA